MSSVGGIGGPAGNVWGKPVTAATPINPVNAPSNIEIQSDSNLKDAFEQAMAAAAQSGNNRR